ncbi:hypothetical protein IWW36_002146 [Coemansia brasiliensis]|uniref:Uncharacterized protein n=1 Tax=Coemansia brasiliensis TaxID=2650707 RepID=A0A9W8I7S3_9FUNG|nr:hypothetical protein IWW36_002146 [Coemansia brasiliensis]
MSELDDELDRAREQSQARFRNAFEAIFAKYGHIDDEDDIIDLETGQLIVDNGRMRSAKAISLGDLLHSSNYSSPKKQRKRHRSLAFRSAMPDPGVMASSPELLTNSQIQSIGANNAEKQHNNGHSDYSDSNESELLDMDFASYSLKYAHRLQHSNTDNNAFDSEDYDNSLSADYESSDSIDVSLDSPLDAYFTSSIEHYLERLRQQLTNPESSKESTGDLSSSSELSASNELFNNTINGLHSSPHTMSSADFDRSNNQLPIDYSECVPESPLHSSEATSNDPLNSHHQFAYDANGDLSEEEPLELYEFRRHNLQGDFHFQPTHSNFSPAVLFKPQPISPHAFFDFNITAAKAHPPNDDDDNASIHSGEPLYAADNSYDLQAQNVHHPL